MEILKKCGSILRWAGGIFIILMGLVELSASIPAAVLFLMSGIFVLPVTCKGIRRLVRYPKGAAAAVPIVLFFCAALAVPVQTTDALSANDDSVADVSDEAQSAPIAVSNETPTPTATPTPEPTPEIGDMTVHFLDVGQGLSVFVQSDGQNLIYDGGDREASSFVVAYLKEQGVTTIDYLISSHYDSDHVAGLIGGSGKASGGRYQGMAPECSFIVLKILDHQKVKAASGLVGVAILPFVAKLGINAGANLSVVISAGPALLLQEFGNLGTILLAMPVALLLGLKREAVGATHSINRETNLALMQDMFGADSPEAQGSLSVYIVGGMVGTIYFGFLASMAAATGVFHPYALGMASGVGAGILMSSAVAALSEVLPAYADEIAALASASETISGIDGIYMAIFIGIPLCNWLYRKLEPTLGRITKAGRRGVQQAERK